MSYQECLDYLFSQLPMFQRIGPKAFKKDLKNIIALTDRLDRPHQDLKCIHIAGTNGKGTVAHLLSSMLQEAGYKVGLYTSPHYRDFRERIRIDGYNIPEQSVIEFVNWYQQFAQDIKASFFEITVAMAFDYFKKASVDIAVIETGLGGRLDSTNIIEQPLLSIITNISCDHTNFLGDTLEKIAGEKAGIIKKNCPVLIGRFQVETQDVFVKKAKSLNSELNFTQDIVSVKNEENVVILSDLNKGWHIEIDNNRSPYFIENLRTSIGALSVLNDSRNLEVNIDSIGKGVENINVNTGYVGRWQILGRSPLIIADSAHNAEGFKTVFSSIAKLPFDALHIVLGVVGDKDILGNLRMFPKDAIYYFSKADIPRGMPAIELQKVARQLGLKGEIYPTINSALKAAKQNSLDNDLIFVGGSVFTVAEVI